MHSFDQFWCHCAVKKLRKYLVLLTGKSLSEALIFALTSPQYDDRLFIELQAQYMKVLRSNLGRTCCVQKLFLTFRTIFVHNMFSPCFAKRRTSVKHLPVQTKLLQYIILEIKNFGLVSTIGDVLEHEVFLEFCAYFECKSYT